MNVDPEAWGVQTHFHAANGEWTEAPKSTVDAILEALGADTQDVPSLDDGPLVLTVGQDYELDGQWTIGLESGERLDGNGVLPLDLPTGYHRLTTGTAPRPQIGPEEEGQASRLLIVAPSACPSMQDVRWWGWTIQLYASRSKNSWGIGDFRDLADFASFASHDGARFGIVNPLHAGLPNLPQEPSPYYPSSREFRNPLYLRIEDIPGADLVEGIDALTKAGRALNSDRIIKRDEVWTLKIDALRKIFAATTLAEDFDEFVERQGESLVKYATFCALSDRHGRPWQQWPTELRHPSGDAVAVFSQENAHDVRFHQWVQWLCERQFVEASVHMPFVQDLAIGVNPAGADGWLWQDVMALGVRVGAPPDEFNTRGQDWGIPPLDPWKLRAANYEPFIRTVRAALATGGGVRIDHVMGLFRLYWIPEGASPTEGTYVSYPWRDLLAIIALESTRSGGIVVGEDLGTIEKYMRSELTLRNILSYKLLWFENGSPAKYPVSTLGAITTHDLPTIAGLFSNRDLEIQKSLNLNPKDDSAPKLKRRVLALLGAEAGTPIDEITARAHHLLAQAPSAIVAATVEDALGLEERPNYPGTTTEWPNRSVALPIDVEQWPLTRGYQQTVAAFRTARGPKTGSSD